LFFSGQKNLPYPRFLLDLFSGYFPSDFRFSVCFAEDPLRCQAHPKVACVLTARIAVIPHLVTMYLPYGRSYFQPNGVTRDLPTCVTFFELSHLHNPTTFSLLPSPAYRFFAIPDESFPLRIFNVGLSLPLHLNERLPMPAVYYRMVVDLVNPLGFPVSTDRRHSPDGLVFSRVGAGPGRARQLR